MSAPEKKWEHQGDLFSVPRARWSNPATSKAAAESISLSAVTETQERILTILKFHGPLSDEQLEENFETYWPGSQPPRGSQSSR